MTPNVATLASLLLVLAACARAAEPQAAKPQDAKPQAAKPQDAKPQAAGSSWGRYKVLVERNAFSRTRGPQAKAEAARKLPERRPERYTVLTGITEQGDKFLAILEEVQGDTTKVAAGGPVAGGTVKAITLDGLVFEKGGKTINVAIGSSLSLGTAPPASGDASPTGTGADAKATRAASTAPATGQDPKAASLLERLRQRRMKELGRK